MWRRELLPVVLLLLLLLLLLLSREVELRVNRCSPSHITGIPSCVAHHVFLANHEASTGEAFCTSTYNPLRLFTGIPQRLSLFVTSLFLYFCHKADVICYYVSCSPFSDRLT